VNLARPVIEQLAEFGETRRGWLGVGIQEVTDDIAASLGRPNTNGAIVVEITKGGPSDGVLEQGDMILQFDGKPVEKMRDLPRLVAQTEVGKAVKLTVLRDGHEQSLDVTLGRLEVGEQQMAAAQPPVPTTSPEDPDEPVGPAPGLPEMMKFDIAPLTDETRKQYSVATATDGVVVTEVKPGSDAEEKGMAPGLVISEVNQQKIETVADVTHLVGAAKEAGRPAVLFKVTDASGASRFLAVRIE
jgi:serine protease Do